MILPIAASKLIPHRRAMAFLPHLTSKDDNKATTSFILENNIFSVDKRVDRLFYIELAAQLAAAFNGFRAISEDREPSIGYLAAIGKADFLSENLPLVGDKVTAKLEETAYAEPFSSVNCEIFDSNKHCFGTFVLKLWEEKGSVVKRNKSVSMDNFNPEQYENLSSIYPHQSKVEEQICSSISAISVQNEVINFSAQFRDSFIGFDGHFDGNEILPGVILLKTVLMGMESCFNRKLEIGSFVRIKFSKSVLPGDIINIKIKGHNPYMLEVLCRGSVVLSGRFSLVE